MDIASLGLRIDIDEVKAAVNALENLVKAAAKAEGKAEDLEKAMEGVGKSSKRSSSDSISQLSKLAAAIKNIEDANLRAAKSETQRAKTSRIEQQSLDSVLANKIRRENAYAAAIERTSRLASESAKRQELLSAKAASSSALAQKYLDQGDAAKARAAAFAINQQNLVENRTLTSQARILQGEQRLAIQKERLEEQKAQAATRASIQQQSLAERSLATQQRLAVAEQRLALQREKFAYQQAQAAKRNSSGGVGGVENIVKGLGSSLGSLGGLLALGGAAGVSAYLVKTADSMTLLESRLKLATKSQKEFNEAQKSLQKSSIENGLSLQDQIDSYTQLERSTRNMGLSVSTLTYLTEGFAKAAIVSGANTESYKSAIIQLNQGLASGVLRGQEFNSVAEQAPAIMEAMANGLRGTNKEFDDLESKGYKGIAALRKMANDGKLVNSVTIPALVEGLGSVNEKFDKMPLTVARAMESVKSSLAVMVNEGNKSTAATEALAGMLKGLADTINAVTGTLTPLNTAGAELRSQNNVANWANDTVNALSYVSDFIQVSTQSLIVFGRNVKYVFESIGDDIGAYVAMMDRAGKLDFSGAAFIARDKLRRDRERRKALDEADAATLGDGKTIGQKIRQQQEALAKSPPVWDAKDKRIQVETSKPVIGKIKNPEPLSTKKPKAPSAFSAGEKSKATSEGTLKALEQELALTKELSTHKDNLNEYDKKAIQLAIQLKAIDPKAKNASTIAKNLASEIDYNKKAAAIKREIDRIQERNKAIASWREEVEKLTDKQERLKEYTAEDLGAGDKKTEQELAAERTTKKYEETLAVLRKIDEIRKGGIKAGASDKEIDQRVSNFLGNVNIGNSAKDSLDTLAAQKNDLESQMLVAQQKGNFEEYKKLQELYTAVDEAESLKRTNLARREMESKAQTFSTLQGITGDMLNALEAAGGKTSGIYKALFAVNKAFAIAQSIIAIQTAMASSTMSLPFPANLAAMAEVAAATGNIVTTIASTNMKFAKGAAFNGSIGSGGVDVLKTPTAFPMSGGRVGIGGEVAGSPEAIMPLSRDANGRLGVSVNGGMQSGGVVQNVSLNITVQGGNTNEETASVISKELIMVMQQIAQATVQKETRQGGILKRS